MGVRGRVGVRGKGGDERDGDRGGRTSFFPLSQLVRKEVETIVVFG